MTNGYISAVPKEIPLRSSISQHLIVSSGVKFQQVSLQLYLGMERLNVFRSKELGSYSARGGDFPCNFVVLQPAC